MRFHLGTESRLLLLTAVPPLVTFLILASGEAWAQRFISIQIAAGTLFFVLSFGSGVTLSSLELGSDVRLPAWSLRLPTLSTGAFALLAAALNRAEFVAPLLMANLLVASVLYRMPGRIFWSRTVLLAQFLPIAGDAGLATLAVVLVGIHIHLWHLGVYRPPPHVRVRPIEIGSAWLASATKEVFYRGHYLVLSSLGLATESYAVVLKFVDLLSRPTDYLFQRLVDHGQIRNRLRRVAFCTPLVGLGSAVGSLFMPGLPELPLVGAAMIGVVSALVFFTKYFAFEHNAGLRFNIMTVLYMTAMIVAAPSLMTMLEQIPLPYLMTSLLTLAALLLGRRLVYKRPAA